jgi:anti-anti-sigma factor
MSDKTRNAAQMEARPHRAAPRNAVLALKPAAAAPQVRARWEEEVAVVAVRGELDRDALWAIDFTIERAAAEAGRIVLDLLEVTHLDYAGVSALTTRRRGAGARGGGRRLAGQDPCVANILKAAGGAELVLCRSVEEASGAELAHAVEARGKVHALAGLRRKGT